MANPTASNSASLKGTVKGATTLVAMMVAPLGNLSIKGFATKVKIRFM